MAVRKSGENQKLLHMLSKMKRSFNDLDQQAKLIVQTDLELNKAQEMSDRRLSSLEALQRISRSISTTLDANEIFERLNQSLRKELDFEKILILFKDEHDTFNEKVHSGINADEIAPIIAKITSNDEFILKMKKGETIASVSATQPEKVFMTKLFDITHFVISPILSQQKMVGIVFLGNQSNATAVTDGDEDLVSILTNQIGQALDNARLFEEVYVSSQVLESKVRNRTQQLATALEEVQNISKAKSDFISAVSHELRTPLTSIKGYASLLMTGKLGKIPEKVKERLGKINTLSNWMRSRSISGIFSSISLISFTPFSFN